MLSSVVLKEVVAWYCSASGEDETRGFGAFHEPAVMSCALSVCNCAMQNAESTECPVSSLCSAAKCQLFEYPFSIPSLFKPRARSRRNPAGAMMQRFQWWQHFQQNATPNECSSSNARRYGGWCERCEVKCFLCKSPNLGASMAQEQEGT